MRKQKINRLMDDEYSFDENDAENISIDSMIQQELQKTNLKELGIKSVKKPSSKRNTKAIDSIYAMQNSLLDKIISKNNTPEELFSFLIYDLMVNHDKSFEKLKSKISEIANDSSEILKKLDIFFLKEKITHFREKEVKLFQELKRYLQNDDIYENDNLNYTPLLCNMISTFIDIATQTKCYKVEIEDRKKYNYTNSRKATFNDVYSLVRKDTNNVKLMGGAIYRESKKSKTGKCNGYTKKYLSLEKEEESNENNYKKRKLKKSDDKSLKEPNTVDTLKTGRIFSSHEESIDSSSLIKEKPLNHLIKMTDETKKYPKEISEVSLKQNVRSFFDETEERNDLCNKEFFHGIIEFNSSEEDPDLKYRIVFKDDFDDQYGFLTKLEARINDKTDESTYSHNE